MHMIEIKSLDKSYGRQKVLQGISLSFEPGEGVALIGPNGSGKTTLLKCILGLVFPDKGEVHMYGEAIRNRAGYRRKIGYMPQISRFPEQLKVRQLFDLIGRLRHDVAEGQRDLELYHEFGIGEWEDKRLGSLSGGMKQQVSAALAFCFSPGLLILDEPTAGLDPLSNERLKAKVKQCLGANKLVLTTSHILNDLEEMSNRVIYLMDGKIQFDESMQGLMEKTSQQKLDKIVAALLNELRSHA